MSRLFIVRGLPGSGKTTFAKRLKDSIPYSEHWEADQYFTHGDEYKFVPEEIEQAHEYCIRGAISAMSNGVDVIVSNTFTRFWEMSDYLSHAEKLGVEVFIIECTNCFGSIHGIPDNVMNNMRKRWIPNKEFSSSSINFTNLYNGLVCHFMNSNDYDFNA